MSDIRLYRDALRQSLGSTRDLQVVGASSLDAACDDARRLTPDVIVLDATGPDAVVLTRSLKTVVPGLSIVVVTPARDEAEFLAWAEAGVSGYAHQNSSTADLVASVQHAARGEVLCSPRVVALLTDRLAKLSAEHRGGTEFNDLTPRERDVMSLVAEGLSNKHIAQRLGISDTTTKNHVHNILDKLGLQSRGQAAAHYVRIRQHPRPEARIGAL